MDLDSEAIERDTSSTLRRQILTQLRDHDQSIGSLHRDMVEIRATMNHMTTSMDEVVDQIKGLTKIVAQHGKTTIAEIAQWLTVAVLASALIAGVVSGIVYVSSGANDVPLALLKYRLDQLERNQSYTRSFAANALRGAIE